MRCTLARGSAVSAALLVRRIRAASGIDAAEAASARRELDTLLAVGRRRGTTPHLREEGELALFVDRDAARALVLARQNFALQKDTPDVRLLLGAALAAGDKPTLAELRRWLASTGFEDRVVAARLRGRRRMKTPASPARLAAAHDALRELHPRTRAARVT